MLFNSFEFIFVFLPVALAGFVIVGMIFDAPAARVLWLATASLAFYGYWNPRFLPVIAVSIVVNFGFAKAIASYKRYARLLLLVAVAANLATLAFYKYANFGIGIINSVTELSLPAFSVTLPLGISFFTFTQIAYLVDVAFGQVYECGFIKYVLFVTYFPHLIAGPIMHHQEMMPQFDNGKARLSTDRLVVGLTVFAIGLFKKAVFADAFATLCDPIFAAALKGGVNSFDAWCAALAYSLQIYFDFSGYCDMAIGISFLFGIVLPFNFDAPYKSQSISEFWHRWHITLSRFLRDYVYIPLGGNRRGEPRRVANLAATMLIGGLWHGAGWTFAVWGGLHGLFLITNHGWARLLKRVPPLAHISETSAYAVASLVLTQVCVVLAWVVFRSDSLRVAGRILSAMTGRGPASETTLPHFDLVLVVAGYLGCLILPNVNEMFRHSTIGLETYRLPERWSLLQLRWKPDLRWGAATAAMLALGLVAMLAVGGGSPFLYFQF
jgi:D-alanyl-lipoteichoic acid acyltransferase DltB (MBOAT superfamily)